jgi:hypothetical protein
VLATIFSYTLAIVILVVLALCCCGGGGGAVYRWVYVGRYVRIN